MRTAAGVALCILIRMSTCNAWLSRHRAVAKYAMRDSRPIRSAEMGRIQFGRESPRRGVAPGPGRPVTRDFCEPGERHGFRLGIPEGGARPPAPATRYSIAFSSCPSLRWVSPRRSGTRLLPGAVFGCRERWRGPGVGLEGFVLVAHPAVDVTKAVEGVGLARGRVSILREIRITC